MEEGLWWEAATSPHSSFLRNNPHPQGVSDRFLSLSRVFIPGKGLWEKIVDPAWTIFAEKSSGVPGGAKGPLLGCRKVLAS